MAVGGRRTAYFPQASSTPPVQQRERSQRTKRDVGFIGEIGNVLGEILHNISTGQIVGSAAGALGASPALQGQLNQSFGGLAAQDSYARQALGGIGSYIGGNLQEFGQDLGRAKEFLFGTNAGQADAFSPEQMRGPDRMQQLLDQANKVLPQFEAVQMLEGAPLDAQSQIAVAQLRETLEQEALQLEQQLESAKTNLAVQNEMFNAWETAVFGEEGLIPGVSPQEAARLNKSLDMGGDQAGVGPAVMEAITAVMGSKDLTGDAKMQRIDFILDQQAVQQEARVGINDFTQNLTDLEKLSESTDVELLLQQGIEPTYVQPSFNLDLVADPSERHVSAVAPYVDELLEQSGATLSPEQIESMTGFISSLGPEPDFENPAVASQIDTISKAIGVDPTRLQDALRNGSRAAVAREDAWANSVTQSRLEPGSEALAIAIFQTAVDKGWPEEMAQAVAENVSLHALIKAKSDGRAGTSRGGSQSGVGGLSEEAYLRLGYDPKEIKGNMQMELSALLDYLQTNFGGDPNQALSYYYGTGEWGN